MKLGEHFSDFMFIARKAKFMTQLQVTKATGMTRSTLSAMEANGESITLANVEKFLTGMGLTLEDFVEYHKAHEHTKLDDSENEDAST